MRRRLIPAALAFTLLGGCQSYEPMPLDQAAVDAALLLPQTTELQSRTAGVKHPLLKPVELHPELGITPDEAAVVSVVVNPALRARRNDRALSQATLLQAGLLPNPQLTFSYDWNTGGTLPGNVNAYGVGVNYDFTALISHAAKVNAAEASFRAVDLDLAWQEWQTAEAAKIAVYGVISLRDQLAVATEIDDRLSENLKVVQHAVDLGLKTTIDAAAAETASRDAHAIVLQLRRDLEHQQLQLNRAMGLPPGSKISVRAGLKLADQFQPPGVQELLAGMESRRLDLLGLKQGYESAEQTLVGSVLDQFPRVSLGLNRASDNTNVRSLGIGASIDLPIFDRNQGNIATNKANRQKLFDEYVSRVFEARADIATAVADIDAINGQIRDVRAALPSLQKLVTVYRDAVDHGNADVLSYYAAWNNLAQKNLDLLKLQQQLAETRVALELAAGRYFQDETAKATTTPSTAPLTAPTTTRTTAPVTVPATAPTTLPTVNNLQSPGTTPGLTTAPTSTTLRATLRATPRGLNQAINPSTTPTTLPGQQR